MANPILRFFDYNQTNPDYVIIRSTMRQLAYDMDAILPDSAEKTVGLRKLLESKDAFLRAALPQRPDPKQSDLFEPRSK